MWTKADSSGRPRARTHCFNMIEVVLGLGLISFGLISTLGLFPVGLNATRDSIAESYSADSVDQFLHFMATKLKDPGEDGLYSNWEDYGLILTTSKPGASEPIDWTTWFADATTRFWSGGTNKDYYKVEHKAAGSTVNDFDAIYRVWRDYVTYSTYDPATQVWTEETALPSVAMALNVEVSWPRDAPYANRRKSLYHLEVYKPQ